MRARLARTVRGWSVALLAGVLSASLHASAGGGFPGAGVVLLAVVLAGLLSTLLVGRTTTLPRLAAAVTGGQLVFHTVFSTLGTAGGVAVVPDVSGIHAGHSGHSLLVVETAAHSGAAHAGPGMLFAHLLAGLCSAMLLLHGERALAAVKRFAVLSLRRLTAATHVSPLPRLRASAAGRRATLPRLILARGSLRYRGPPAVLVA